MSGNTRRYNKDEYPQLEAVVAEESLVVRLHKRAEIREQISTRKSVQNNEPDRISMLLREAAVEIERLQEIEFQYESVSK